MTSEGRGVSSGRRCDDCGNEGIIGPHYCQASGRTPSPLLCRLGWHRWDVWSADFGRYVERRCVRGWRKGYLLPCPASARRGWHSKRWVPKPTIVCTHSVHGTALPACVRCANERPYPW